MTPDAVRGEAVTMDTNRQPRATQREMAEREQRVARVLSNGPATIADIFEDSGLTYSQAIILLRRMEAQGKIFKLGKDGKNVIYALASASESPEIGSVDNIPFNVIIDQIHQGNTNVKIVGLNLTPDHLMIGLQLPTGEIMNAELVTGEPVEKYAGAA